MNIIQVIQKQAKKAGARTIAIITIVPILFVALSLYGVNVFLKISSEKLQYEDALKAANMAKGFNDYIEEVELVVETAAEGIEYLTSVNASYDEIHAYMTEKSQDIPKLLKDYTEGLYGYIDGEYNDGYDWIPYEGYDPRERIWYQEAVTAGGKIVLVEPYIDARTENLVVTVAKVLKNGEDVIAADIDLSGLQKLTMDIADQINDHDVIVMDKDGWIIASSKDGEVGRKISEDESQERRAFYSNWKASNGNTFFTDVGGKRYLISQQEIGYGWTAFALSDVGVMYRSLAGFAIIGVIGIVLLTALIIIIMILMARRRLKAEDNNDSLDAVAKIFTTLHKIDLDENTFQQLQCHDYKVSKVIGEERTDASKTFKRALGEAIERRYLDEVMEFADLETLNSRMGSKDSISMEFLNYEHFWFRGRFIVVDRHADGSLKTVLWATELIDEEKRFRDQMQFLAETDQLTGINNRGSGEKKIRQLLGLGKGGMFILFDVDKFKSINDTYGHEAGDKVLIAIADCMKRSFRDRDIVLRLGGDEFAAYVPYVFSRQEGEPIVNRFIESVKKIDLPEIEGRKINISIGVSFFRNEDTYTFDELYKKADSRTYESKKIEGCFATYNTDFL